MEKSCVNCGYSPVNLGRYCVDCYVKLHNEDGSLKEKKYKTIVQFVAKEWGS